MLAIRLARVGKNKRAQFKVVLQEHTVAPGGRHIEILGSYDPHLKKSVFKDERVKYWISQGAKVSDTVYNLFVSNGIISGEKRKVKIPTKVSVEAPAAEEKKAEAKPEEEKRAESKEEKKPALSADREEAKEEKPAEKAEAEEEAK